MAEEKGALRAVLGPAIAAMGLVGAIALFVSSGREEEPANNAGPPPTSPFAPAPAPVQTPPSQLTEPVVPPAAQGSAAPVAASPAPAPGSDSGALPAALYTPEVLAHGRQMLLPAVLRAVDRGEVGYLRQIRSMLGDPRAKNVFPPADVEALDLVIDCVDHAPDARDEGRDFLQFAPNSLLAEALKRACE